MSAIAENDVHTSSRASTPRIAIVVGHPVLRGVVRLACEGLDHDLVLEEYTNDLDASSLLRPPLPEVIVIDLAHGEGTRILQAIATAADRFSAHPNILVLGDRNDGAAVLEALKLGASGYVTKGDGLRHLTGVLRDVAEGRQVLAPTLEAAARDELGRFVDRAREAARTEARLTPREREVLGYLAEGTTLRQVGRRVGISPRTVETHVRNIYRKLGTETRLQAVSRAAALGIVRLD